MNSRPLRADTDDWQARAACASPLVSPEIFFPPAWPAPRDWARQAKAVCAGCPVMRQCLRAALMQEEKAGVWGGMRPLERRALTRTRSGSTR
ncbi:WhiB family transcriptional regulator [Streptomyces sp. NPDC099088]|uniref:WhiB family transcriptional regulator n=1 Tax=Streptomyces sp. NPDC099088 TaxID=3366101 RepID=UPI00381BD063